GVWWAGRNDPPRRPDPDRKRNMTVHNSTDALAAEMMAIGAAARDAARAMREASDEAKTKALKVAAAAIRTRAAEILAANRGDIEAAKTANMPDNMIDRLA